ncbi:glycoside hydrolase family 3 C-terminal domain-containing protein [Salipaludibacillus sp. HK11]|uniref:glycoside hydrolase family 3 C-terminal domain-containing protein n=1 Tax=Salipaludibacillus sp. HK11 TaxID=3394320 RepID=UPI0039FC5DCF
MIETNKYRFQNVALSFEERARDLVSRFTLDEKIELMMQHQPEISRLGVKAYKQGTEAAHGLAWLGEATVFPQNIGLSHTWNPSLMKKIGTVIGDEARVFFQKDPAINGLTLWAPTVDMERDPRWGRTEEAYGEDPELTGQLTKELVKGMQGDDPVYFKSVATLKHFLGNNNEVDRGSCSASIDPRNMYEYYLKAFKPAIVEGKAKSIMTAYNSINGTPAILHPYVQEIVKDEWGMDGFIVSDAGDVLGIVKDHHYYEKYSEALAETIRSGIDSITDDADDSIKAMHDAIDQGILAESDLDKALENAFGVRFRLGEFDPEENPYAHIPESKLLAPEHQQLSYQAAQEQMVLLKNDGLLPLSKEVGSVAVVGSLADEVYIDWYSGTAPYKVTPFEGIHEKIESKDIALKKGSNHVRIRSKNTGHYIGIDESNGQALIANKALAEEAELFEMTDWGWGSQTLKSLSTGKFVTAGDEALTATADEARGWFVKEQFSFEKEDSEMNQVLKSWNGKPICALKDKPLYVQEEGEVTDVTDQFELEIVVNGLSEAMNVAEAADTAVVFVGNNPFINGKEEVDRDDIVLPPAQEQLVRSVKEVNPNTIVVIVSSYPYAVNWCDKHVPGIIYTSHAGPDLGSTVADVLFGDYNPAGRLSMTWYKSIAQLPDIKDYDIIKGKRTYQYFDGEVLYPFGHGLSYTEFKYSDVKLSKNKVGSNDEVNVFVEVENIGVVTGDEVVQLYVRANQSRVKRPLKTLKEFNRITLQPRESKQVEFTLAISELEMWDVTRDKYCVESGAYTIMIGRSAENILTEAVLKVAGEVIPPRLLSDGVQAINYDDYHQVILDEAEGKTYCVRTTQEGGYIAFHDVALGGGTTKFQATAYTNSGSAGLVEIRVGSEEGTLIAKITINSSETWQQLTSNLTEVKGNQNIFVVMKGDVKLSWLRLY